MKKWISLLLTILPIAVVQAESSRLLRFADIHQDMVTFVYAGDIYLSNWKTHTTQKLTAHSGQELFPKFSPNGQTIAFSAEFSGNRQIYTIALDGSNLQQLTYYNDVGPMPPRGGFDYQVLDWSKDGESVLFRANRTPWGKRMGKPYLVPAAGGMPKPLGLPESGGGMFSPSGEQFVYTPISREWRTWKRYKGGRAQDVWIWDRKKQQSERLTHYKGTDNQPTWIGDNIYFTSDRNYTLNLYQHQQGQTPKQVTFHDTYDVLWPSAGPHAIVYENGGYLYRFDPKTAQSTQLNITTPLQHQYTQPYFKNVSQFIDSIDLSHDAKRVLVAARGELLTIPAQHGEIKQLTRSLSHREISASYSPNGQFIAFYSDQTGEYQLYIRDLTTDKPAQAVTKKIKMWRYPPVWSGNNRYLLFADHQQTLQLYDRKKKKQIQLDHSDYSNIEEYTWSPNNQDIVYTKLADNNLSSLWHYNLNTKKTTQLTTDWTNDFSPSFSPDGQQLYFISKRDHNLSFSSYEFNYLYHKADRIYAASVAADGESLFTPNSDEVSIKIDDSSKEDKSSKENKESNKSDFPTLDSAGFNERVVVLGASAADYSQLTALNDNVLALKEEDLYLISSTKKEKEKLVAKHISRYRVAGKKVLVQSKATLALINASPKQNLRKNALDLSSLEIKIDPKQEWQQMYVEAWRTLRDWFYDPNLHGMDWPGIRAKYQPLVDTLTYRADLDYILSEIAGELNAGHVYVQAGDQPKIKRRDTGLLGAELVKHSSGYFQIQTVFSGENWHENFRSPLTEAQVTANEGDFILAINGQSTQQVNNIYQLLENTVGKSVELTLSKQPKVKDSWTTVVHPTAQEGSLRYLTWIKNRQALVEKLSNGRIGYIHLPNTHVDGNRELLKNFYPQINKDALIIDDRYNGGGFIPNRMIEILSRKTLNSWQFRGVKPNPTPFVAHDGPKAMLINGYSSSGGDALPYYFRQLQLGKIIGTRTWGGLIGISGNPALVDGGQVLASTFRILNNEGEWIIENEGVSPDIEVFDLPEAIMQGQDPSLERAVQELLKDLEANPRTTQQSPPAPTKF